MIAGKKSIRQKITRSYICSFSFILFIASILFLNLILIDERLRFNAVISRYLELTLEIRRFEKNYFLYKKKGDYKEVLTYVDSVKDLVMNNKENFDELLHAGIGKRFISFSSNNPFNIPDNPSQVIFGLFDEYRSLLERYAQKRNSMLDLETDIRLIGRKMTDLAEGLTRYHSENIHGLLSLTKNSLIAFVIFFFLASIVVARIILQSAIHPLKELEKSMRSIASGTYEMLPATSRDNEIVSLNNAFNRMINELLEQRKEIVRTEKMASLGTMLTGIAHEINNPLSNISSSAEILFEELDCDDLDMKAQLTDQIINETGRAKDIIRTILEFTREKKFEKKEIALMDTIMETKLFVRGDLPPHISVNIDIPDDITVYADKQKIQQAFLNLFKNGIDALSDRSRDGKIEITALRSDEGDIEIRFSDNGKGIPEPLLDKIFDPFFTTKDVGAGTGLGLYLTHHIVDQHKGSIKVNSQLGRGSTFTITLPPEGMSHGYKG